MKRRLYAFFDKKAQDVIGGQQAILTLANDVVAQRVFEDVVKLRDTVVGQHIEDFSLICVGELIESATGEIAVAPVYPAETVVDGVEWLVANNPVPEAK